MVELFKYARNMKGETIQEKADNCNTCQTLAKALNDTVEKGSEHTRIGAGILITLSKPGKPKGPPTSLRPITLINMYRKLLSLITLQRAQAAGAYAFLPSTQFGFRKGHSTTDAMFLHRLLIGCARSSHHFKYWILSADLKSAFDTPSRKRLHRAMKEATASDPTLPYSHERC